MWKRIALNAASAALAGWVIDLQRGQDYYGAIGGAIMAVAANLAGLFQRPPQEEVR